MMSVVMIRWGAVATATTRPSSYRPCCLPILVLGMLVVRSAGAAPAAIPVGPADVRLPLARDVEVLEDAGRRLTLAEVRDDRAAWKRLERAPLNPGFSKSVWWLRLRLRSSGAAAPIERILEIDTALQDFVDAFILRPTGEPIRGVETGDRRPFGSRERKFRTFLFPLVLHPDEEQDIYLRLYSHDGLFEATPLVLRTEEDLLARADTETLALGMYYGCLAGLLLYNVFLFASTRTASFGFYTLYMTAFLFWNLTFRGYSFQYLWPSRPDFNNQALAVSSALSFSINGIFTLFYLQMRTEVARWLYRTNIALGVLCGVPVIPALLGRYASSFALGIPLGSISMICSFGTGILLLARGSRPARFYVVAFGFLASGVILYYLRLLSVLPSSVLTEYGLQIGSALEMLLLALGLADAMNTLRAEKAQADRDNEQLSTIAMTDALTSAYNRRHFDDVFPRELARRVPLLFALFDLDHFKGYNDRYGHQKGDTALRAVAAAARSCLRRADDLLFRLGGEEFGILVAIEEDKGAAFIDRVRQKIQELGIGHSANPVGVVTASFGVMWLPPGPNRPSATSVYALTDRLLYRAKSAGRNRIEIENMERSELLTRAG